jgi:hypothetical protein
VLGQAYGALARTAAVTSAKEVDREYFELFIGVGRGELLPYTSFYLTGFLNERPLADLRADLARLGIARAEGRHEPEDHIALLFEVMADMAHGEIAGDQAAFFDRHIGPLGGPVFRRPCRCAEREVLSPAGGDRPTVHGYRGACVFPVGVRRTCSLRLRISQ